MFDVIKVTSSSRLSLFPVAIKFFKLHIFCTSSPNCFVPKNKNDLFCRSLLEFAGSLPIKDRKQHDSSSAWQTDQVSKYVSSRCVLGADNCCPTDAVKSVKVMHICSQTFRVHDISPQLTINASRAHL
eukprot:TRINITY_DN1187_c0_g2_i1.p3 TRINITY_DN1187_c0_g2~~TRINITY_DN1187_c0_g2_i1.p3  ORF type:complete len:128 (+),score=7.13 TRINITY_DN1187_c0_g2_i1:77-460(+)